MNKNCIVSLDPGADGCVAYLDPDRKDLRAATYSKLFELARGSVVSCPDRVGTLIVEKPSGFEGLRKKPPSALLQQGITLGRQVEGLIQRVCPTAELDWVAPVTWNRGRNKLDTSELVKAALKSLSGDGWTVALLLPSAKSKHHNIYDAVGISLYAFRRSRYEAP